MLPQFTTHCHVQIEDSKKRKDVCNILDNLEYLCTCVGGRSDDFIITHGADYSVDYQPFQDDPTSINCGANIELFLILASMRGDTDKGQWFTTKGSEWRAESWWLCQSSEIYNDCLGGEYRRATAQEIVERFNCRGQLHMKLTIEEELRLLEYETEPIKTKLSL